MSIQVQPLNIQYKHKLQKQNTNNRCLIAFKAIGDVHNSTLPKKVDFKKVPFTYDELVNASSGLKMFNKLTDGQVYSLFAGDLSSIVLNRCCPNLCSHCYIDAKPPYNNEDEVKSIAWEDYEDLTDDLETMKLRLKQSPLRAAEIFPFLDSEPFELKSFDRSGKPHNIAEASKRFYEKTGKPFGIITAGWNVSCSWPQKAADELVKEVQKNPKILSRLNISLHPFQVLMTKSIKLLKQSEEASNPELLEQSKIFRTVYVKRMANVLNTFKPLFESKEFSSKTGVILEYQNDKEQDKYYDTDNLYKEVRKEISKTDPKYAKLLEKQVCEKRTIKNIGRANTKFNNDFRNINSTNINSQEFQDYWKVIDVNGRILVKKDFGIPIKTNLYLNYSTKNKNTPKSEDFKTITVV